MPTTRSQRTRLAGFWALAALLFAAAAPAVAAGEYRLVLTGRADQPGGQDLFIVTYDSFDALISSPPAAGGAYSGIDVGNAYTVAGLSYDGKYRLALASRTDRPAGQDLFVVTYDTFDDLINSPPGAGGAYSGIDVGNAYTVAGLAFEARTPPVPEPATGAMLSLGLAVAAWGARRRRQAPQPA